MVNSNGSSKRKSLIKKYDDFKNHSADLIKFLLDQRIWKRSRNLDVYTCYKCKERVCTLPVKYKDGVHGTQPTPFIICQHINREDDDRVITLQPEELTTYAMSLYYIADWLSREISNHYKNPDSTLKILISDRLWWLGTLKYDSGQCECELLLIEGADWEDAATVFANISTIVPFAEYAVLARSTIKPEHHPFPVSTAVIPYTDFISFENKKLVLHIDKIIRRLPARNTTKPSNNDEEIRYSPADSKEIAICKAQNILKRRGDNWKFCYNNESIDIKDGVGIHYIAFLLKNPNQKFEAMHLVIVEKKICLEPDVTLSGMNADQLAELNLNKSSLPEGIEIMDFKYKAHVRTKLKELGDLRDVAVQMKNNPRAKSLEEEISEFRRSYSEGVGLSGRNRTQGSLTERARRSVNKAINRFLNKLQSLHPKLHAHLTISIHRGAKCSYFPAEDPNWKF